MMFFRPLFRTAIFHYDVPIFPDVPGAAQGIMKAWRGINTPSSQPAALQCEA
ncbi:hypothetical protein E2C01_092498 [Portunus trituberculatus]|uniref:Uncharacterized protein n=1 Tax=Portunus trituberculatus TaxID=210409 RepID=A0A5B7JVL5_PORTR|nr:hypothetical protein [Portunus trituberculatus]